MTKDYNGTIVLRDSRLIEIGKVYDDIPNHIYHGSIGLGSTSIKNMNPEQMAPALFAAYRNGDVVFETMRGSRIGSCLHAMTLTPDTWQKEIKIYPVFKRGGDESLAEKRTRCEKENPAYIWVNEDELDVASQMYPVLISHPEVEKMLDQINTVRDGAKAGGCEQSVWYNDVDIYTGEGTYKLCKYRPDIRYMPAWEPQENTFIADLKVTVQGGGAANKFWRTIDGLGYHISAAHYVSGELAAFNRRPGSWRWIVQEYEKPYLVACYKCEEKTLKYGMWLRRRALNAYAESKRMNDWPSYSYNKATEIGLPGYITSRMEK